APLGAAQGGGGAGEIPFLQEIPAAFHRIGRSARHRRTIARFAWHKPRRYSPADERETTRMIRRSSLPGATARAVAALLVVLIAACPGRTKRQVGGDLPIPTDGDATARRRFEETRARFRRDGGDPAAAAADAGASAQVSAEFEQIARDYPDDPIAPHALLFAGVAALDAGQPERAAQTLGELVEDDDVSPELVRRSQLFHGVALGYLGRHEDALAALDAGVDALDRNRPDELAAYHAAAAE